LPLAFADMKNPTTWAHEPEVTAMAFCLETTIACYSYNSSGVLKDHSGWALYAPTPCGNRFTNPIILLVDIDQFHFEPVSCYKTP